LSLASASEFLRHVWHAWKRTGRRIGDFQARVFLTVFFFTIVAPFALAIRWAADPLALGPRGPRGWRPRTETPGTPLERARRQF
jgi:hypothetical protein